MFESYNLAAWQVWLGIVGVAIVSHLFGQMFVDALRDVWKEVHGWRVYVFAVGFSLLTVMCAWIMLSVAFDSFSWRNGWYQSLPVYLVLALSLLFGPRLRRRMLRLHGKTSTDNTSRD